MITRQVRCKKCGVTFPLICPEKLSDIGMETIRYCPQCLHTEILKHESRAKEIGEEVRP